MERPSTGYGLHMQRFIDAGPTDRLGIYLNDHRGLFAAEHALAKRCHDANSGTSGGTDLAALLTDVIAQNTDDRAQLDSLLDVVGTRANPFKTIGARLGERFGRLKLNGQLRGYSPLSRVIEIEALLASTSVRRAMWSSLAATMPDEVVANDATSRSTASDRHHRALIDQQLDATAQAFTAEPLL